MIVRRATPTDVEAMVAFGRKMHELSDLRRFPFDERGASTMAYRCMFDPDKCAFLAQDEGVVGILAGMACDLDYTPVRYATDILCVADKPGAGFRLMRTFTHWAFGEQKVDRIYFGESFGGRDPSKAESFYKRLGAKRTGGFYVMEHL